MIQTFLTRGVARLFCCISIILGGYIASIAQSISAVECICIEIPNNERFRDSIIVQSGTGEIWMVTSVSGLFEAYDSDILISGPLTNVASGVYSIVGYRNAGSDFSITVENDENPIDELTLDSESLCVYPRIIGDDDVCINSLHQYSLNISEDLIVGLDWELSGGGTIITDDGLTTITVQWDDDTTMTYTLTVSGTYSDGVEDCDLAAMVAPLEVTLLDEPAIVLACDNFINLSLDADCEVEIIPDMILEGMQFPNNSYDIVLVNLNTGEILEEPIVNGDDVGMTFLVKVIHECSENSCWGYILVEDKYVPALFCESDTVDCDESLDPEDLAIGFPFPMNATVTPMEIGEGEYLLEGFDLCGDAILTYMDSVAVQDCESDYGSIIYRKWKVTDESGRMNMCYETLYLLRTDIMEEEAIEWPPNFDVDNPLNCNDKDADPEENDDFWVSDENGFPAPIDPEDGGTGYPIFEMCGFIEVTYSDTKYEKCGGAAYKIKRRWIVLDWCTQLIRTHNQLISVLDDEPPICVAPPDKLVGYTSPGACVTSFKVPPLAEIIDCSETTVMVGYKPKKDDDVIGDFSTFITDGVTGPDANGYFTIPEIQTPTDSVWIAYLVTDECGNSCEAFTEVKIIDKEEPTAVCDLHTVVSLNESGMGWANVYAIDDGSHDNCGIETLEVKRKGYLDEYGDVVISNSSCGEDFDWGQTMKFCCEDVGTIQIVELRITDGSGISNVCWAEVEVQDNTPPILLYCPPNQTITCSEDYSDLSIFGLPIFEDDCALNYDSLTIVDINDCGVGKITRVFKGVDHYGNGTNCIQVITVNPPNVIKSNDIIWPQDYKPTNGCSGDAIHPDNLAIQYSYPRIKSNVDLECTLIEIDFEDLVFHYQDEACKKILRTWSVIDWCRFQYDGQGALYHTQLIKINNNTPPSIDTEFTVTGAFSDCQFDVILRATVEDDCPESSLEVTYEIDLFDDNLVDHYGSGTNADGSYPGGSHKITWKAIDECGNEGIEDYYFDLIDDKEPTPICITELVTVIMKTSQSVTIWASDFADLDKGSDNCDEQLDASFSGTDIDEKSYTITCEDLNGQQEAYFELEVWVWDDEENRDFCMVYLRVQDNSNVCGDESEAQEEEEEQQVHAAIVAGAIYSESHEMLSEVQVMVDADLAEYPYYQQTEGDGHYAFESLPMHYQYQIEATKQGYSLNGISTLDLVLIQKHIMGTKHLDSPYKVIAADANGSRSITASDLVILRKLLLGLIDELPGTSSWRFVDAGFDFKNPLVPFPFREYIKIQDLQKDRMDANFVAVKIGDVNGSAKPNYQMGDVESRNLERAVLYVNPEDFPSAGEQILPVYLKETGDVYGFQMSLHLDPHKIELIDVEAGQIPLHAQNIAISKSQKGLVAMSWHQNEALSLIEGEPLFFLRAKVDKGTELASALSLDDQFLQPEMYFRKGLQIAEKEINWRTGVGMQGDELEIQFSLEQNIPNPFHSATSINYWMPDSGPVTLEIYGMSGKLMHKFSQISNKGKNTIVVDSGVLDGPGLYYYHLKNPMNSATRKMIVLR